MLIGEAGVGKTAIVEGLAARIVDGDVPETLRGKRVVALDLAGMVAGTRYRGDFEERLKKVIDEIRAHSDELIVFIDELHTVVGAGGGGEGAMDAGNILKPRLARGELHMIGATTLDEYRRSIEKDAALERRFQPVLVAEPASRTPCRSCAACATATRRTTRCGSPTRRWSPRRELSDRYITDRYLPDKAIDLIDQAGARRAAAHADAADRRARRWSSELERAAAGEGPGGRAPSSTSGPPRCATEIAEVQARARRGPGAGGGDGRRPPRSATSRDRRGGLPGHRHPGGPAHRGGARAAAATWRSDLHERVDRPGRGGRARSPTRSAAPAPAWPTRTGRSGSFLFLGPTGVGKTELAQALAEALFGDADRMVRLDMSEFRERHTVAGWSARPPGYVGYERGRPADRGGAPPPVLGGAARRDREGPPGRLQHAAAGARRRPADRRPGPHGRLHATRAGHDDQPRLGAISAPRSGALGFARRRRAGGRRPARAADAAAAGGVPAGVPQPDRRDRGVPAARRPSSCEQITELLLEETRRRLRAPGHRASRSPPAAVDWLAEHGYEPEFGARPLRRVIQREVDNRLSRMLLERRARSGAAGHRRRRDGELTFAVGAEPNTVAGLETPVAV